ncbi:MAG: hypothetical protein ACE147_05565 [Candidatus Methylomirabilales bacterium]
MTTSLRAAQRVWLGAVVLATGLATSGCGIAYQVTLRASEASTRSYQRQTAEYQRQARDLDGQWRGVLATQRVVEARIAAHAKAVKDEQQLAEQNAALRRRIAEAEQEVSRREAAAAAAEAKREPPVFAELGKRLPEAAYAAAVQEATAYEELKGHYARQLQALASQPKGSPARRREGELVRGRAVLEVIADALALANVPRAALRDPAPGDEPASRQALAALAGAQDALLAALQDFALRAGGRREYGDEEARRYIEVEERIGGLRTAVEDGLAAVVPDGADARLTLASRLEALSAVLEVAGDTATSLAIAMKSGAAPAFGLAAKDQPPLAERLLQLVAAPAPAADERPESAHRAAPGLGRIPRIAAMAAYTQGPAFDPEAYLQMRLQELQRLQAAVGEVIRSYRSARGI